MEHWRTKTARHTALTLAPHTRLTYIKGCEEFFQFYQDKELGSHQPVEMDYVLQFAVHLQDRGLASTSIKAKLAGLAFHLKTQGLKDPTQDFRVRKLLESWARCKVPQQDSRAPFSPSMLSRLTKIWPLVCSDDYEAILFRAIALLAFF